MLEIAEFSCLSCGKPMPIAGICARCAAAFRRLSSKESKVLPPQPKVEDKEAGRWNS